MYHLILFLFCIHHSSFITHHFFAAVDVSSCKKSGSRLRAAILLHRGMEALSRFTAPAQSGI
ncbi:MAG: hypothetical protein NTV22_18665, partial [bacterium]|nr:hypothetical protein [bacterium]